MDGQGIAIGKKAAVTGLAQVLALADCQMYHIPAKEEYADMKYHHTSIF